MNYCSLSVKQCVQKVIINVVKKVEIKINNFKKNKLK